MESRKIVPIFQGSKGDTDKEQTFEHSGVSRRWDDLRE